MQCQSASWRLGSLVRGQTPTKKTEPCCIHRNRSCCVSQEELNPAADVPQAIANVAAVALFLGALRAAGPKERAWGLPLWAGLLRGSMVNLSACERWNLLLCPRIWDRAHQSNLTLHLAVLRAEVAALILCWAQCSLQLSM